MEKTLFASLVITVAVNSTLGFVIRDRHRSEEAANGRSEERVHDVERGHAVEVPSISENLLRSSTGDESIESKGKQKQHAIEKYLKEYGYAPRFATHFNRKTLNRAIRRFAIFNRVKMGKDLFDIFAKRRIESAIKKKTQRQRCGNPDIGQAEFGKSPNSGKKSYVKRYVAQTPWGKSNLTYKIAQFGQDLSQTVQRQEFQKAFKMWTDAAPGLDVREAQGNEIPDISIEFARGTHSGCSVPFDGPGLVVAHAFYPEDGRIHFDEDEQFSTGGEKNKVNLMSIAAHEIGHALGLSHSSDTTAIMYAEYQDYRPNLDLAQDDVDGIQYLYPAKVPGKCTDEFWCEDILQSECAIFKDHCKLKCGACST